LDGIKKIGIWGFGREGRAAFNYIRDHYPDIDITILNDTQIAEEIPARFVYGQDISQWLKRDALDLVVKSPGISLYRAEIADAKRRGLSFTSVTNLWFEQYPDAYKIVVTGTKGKSTTSRLLQHLLIEAGMDTLLIGNVGIPALGHQPPRDYTIFELSSYQIADLQHPAQMALVTNLFPEHAPWHGGAQQYFADKLRILELSQQTIGVCNYANEQLRKRVEGKPNITWFNSDPGYRVHDGKLYFDNTEIKCLGFPLKGEHNLSNLAAACTVADILDIHKFRECINLGSFKQLDHRLEEFRVGSGLLCVDDSISTVPEATIAALKAYPDVDKILFLGGTDRGQDYTQLLSHIMEARVKEVLLLRPAGERILSQISESCKNIRARCVATLEQGVAEAMRSVRENDLIMLSPAAPSFGEFRDFEERGRAFKELCRRYAPSSSRPQEGEGQ